MNALPRIQHPKVRGGKRVTRACQLLSILACLKWGHQALKGQVLNFSAPILHQPPTSRRQNSTQEKTEQAEQGWEGSNQAVSCASPPTAQGQRPLGGGRTGHRLWVLGSRSARESHCRVSRLFPASDRSLLPDPSDQDTDLSPVGRAVGTILKSRTPGHLSGTK